MRVPAAFTGTVDETQYGVEGRKSYIHTYVKGYPEPKATWFFMGHPVSMIKKSMVSIVTAYTLTNRFNRHQYLQISPVHTRHK